MRNTVDQDRTPLEVLAVDEEPSLLSSALKQTCRQAEAGRVSANSTMTTSKPKLATRKIFFLHLVSFETYLCIPWR